MTHLDGQAGLVGKMLQLVSSGAGPIRVAPARIGSDVQPCGVRVGPAAHLASAVANRLQPVAQAVQDPAHRGRTHPPPVLGQRRRQFRGTLAGLAQRRGRVPARVRVCQRFECGSDAGLILLNARSSGARAPDAARRRLGPSDFPRSLGDRLLCQTGGRRDKRGTAMAIGQRLCRRPPAAAGLRPARAARRRTCRQWSLPALCPASPGKYGRRLYRERVEFGAVFLKTVRTPLGG